MTSFTTAEIKNWSNAYSSAVSANMNKKDSVNRWFPILEGFSNNFVESILDENKHQENFLCLDPFGGGGTTPLVCQKKGIKCYSFEVSPFMSQVCRAKLRNDYNEHEFAEILREIESLLSRPDFKHNFNIGLKTATRKKNLEKWLFHKASYDALLNVRKAIDLITDSLEFGSKYIDILYVTLGSMLLQFSNVYRNGKALKYKDNWRAKIHRRKKIYETFLNKCRTDVFFDISKIKNNVKNNFDYFFSGDCRQLIDTLENNSIDLIITSPPYLNSRDYTDSHMVELWFLGHVNSYEEVRGIRKKTMRSHVQVAWTVSTFPKSILLEKKIAEIMLNREKFWNKNIPNMVIGYFCDLQEILEKLKNKMKNKGRIYLNVANSSYFGVVIETDRIIEEIAYNLGYKVSEIRLARKIKTSSQQSKEVRWLRESVIVLQNNK